MPVFQIIAQMQSRDATLDGFSTHWVYTSQGSGAVNVQTAQDLITIVDGFYQSTAAGQSAAIGTYLSSSLDRTKGLEYYAYDLTSHLGIGTHKGSPIAQVNKPWTLSTPTNTIMPEGVAAVLSFRRDFGTDTEFIRDPQTHKVIGRPRMQDRGRIYIGPLQPTAFFASSSGRTVLGNTFMTDCLLAFDNASTVVATDASTWHLQQWSRKKASTADIVQTWMDDRPDYQRRRTDQSAIRMTGTFSY